ncbi:uncharacterized protein A1O5_11827 [Cladophialophora psammophila CBS 110553]|uniref:Cation efflux protein transmembrane domain-containing protein n=1 Tax=Cladophialophora psammophila CBS 110553 TaxID=1182543 RepID=W9W8E4_9EURO|nr:uncharacterized protein A1O5_11827 [Cladophialophora psammophila CBS 110553]EXJ61270.1 hypothetical protein A1O5_11827 [Cladophialophora psammophila CBS 110553]
MVGKRTLHPPKNQADDHWRQPDLESGNHNRRFPGFKDAVEYALDRQTTAVLKEQLREGVDRGAFEKARKSDKALKQIENKKVRKFFEKQNATLNDWAEVDTIVLAMADEVMESMNTDADHDGIREREGRLQHADQNARWAININVIANIILFVDKGIAALKSSSLSLIASLVDSALDLLCTGIVWATNKLVSWRLSALARKFPVGRRRLEPIGILVFSIIMVISFLQILQESIARLLPNGLIGLGCMRIKTTQVQALAQDCKTDVYFNTLSLLFPLIGKQAGIWWLDPLGAALLSLYILYDWAGTCVENVSRLCGLAVDETHQKKLIYLAYRFRALVSGFKSVIAYHAGDGVWTEFDILLDGKTPLRRTHDIAETLQYCCEALTEVDRAFVTTDYSAQNPGGHSQNLV